MKWTRRAVIGAPFGGLAATELPLAICSETFGEVDFSSRCRMAREAGYTGIEVDPANLSPDPAALSAGQRGDLRRTMQHAGIVYVGLHSFLKTPPGLHLTTSDTALRMKSWQYFGRLIELAGDLGEGAVMVLGSSRQRSAVEGTSVGDALKRLEEGLARMAPVAKGRGVKILLEPLSPRFSNIVNTLGEAVRMVERIGSPAVSSMFDSHNTDAEKEPIQELVRRHARHIGHVHLNEMDGKRPGAGNYPFGALVRVLKEVGYKGWLSVEPFTFEPDGETLAREAARYLRGL